MNKPMTHWKRWQVVVAFWAVLLTLVSVVGLFDLQISINLQHSMPGFAYFFEVVGAAPFFLIILLFAYSFFNDNDAANAEPAVQPSPTPRNSRVAQASEHGVAGGCENLRPRLLYMPPKVYVPAVVGVFGLAFFMLCTMLLGYASAGSVSHGFSYMWWTLPLSVAVTVGAWFLSRRFPLHLNRSGVLKGILFLGVILVFNQLCKGLWGRTRPEDLQSVADFTRWFVPQGITGNASFPSGHTTLSMAPLALLFLVKGWRPWLAVFACSMMWGCLTAASRIIEGAHFPTDVLFAMGSTLFLFLLVSWYGDRFIGRWILTD